jgi:ATP-binding cassette subfamily B protein
VPNLVREAFVFENAGSRYPSAERRAVRHLSFALAPGELVALVGETGAGKTTLVKLLARF